MSHQLPPLVWLRAFEATARHLSFTRAANELNLTQAAISKQVKLLEFHLREQLFVRRARSLEMTKSGEAYLPKVRDAFERLAAGTNEVFGNRKSGILTVRSAVGLSVNWLAPKLRDFREKHPKVRLRVISSVWNEEVGDRKYDFDIRYGTGKYGKLRSDRLTWETITPLCAPSLLDPDRGPEQLGEHMLIHVLGYEEGWATWFRAAETPLVDPGEGLQTDTSLLAFELAASGGGVALGRSSMAQKEIEAGRLVKPFDLEVGIEEAFHLVESSEDRIHPDAEVFRNWLLETVRPT